MQESRKRERKARKKGTPSNDIFRRRVSPKIKKWSIDLLSRTVTRVVPSTLRGLTTVFGMGTGVSLSVRTLQNWRQLYKIGSFQKNCKRSSRYDRLVFLS